MKTSIDASLYSGVQLTLSHINLNGSFSGAETYMYLTDGTNNSTIAYQYRDWGGNVNGYITNPTVTLNFTKTSGLVNVLIVVKTPGGGTVFQADAHGGTLKLIGRKC